MSDVHDTGKIPPEAAGTVFVFLLNLNSLYRIDNQTKLEVTV